MKMKYVLPLVAIVLVCVPVGCATDSSQKQAAPKDNRPVEERIKVGMTKAEVRQAMGEPAGRTTNSDGLESWNYNDNAKMFIPFYAIAGGKIQQLNISFDAEGKVKSWSTGKAGLF